MKKKTWNRIINSICIIFAGVLLTLVLLYKKFSTETVTMAVTFISVILIYYFFVHRRNEVTYDEFTVYQDLKSFRNSWILTLLVAAVIGDLDYFGIYSFHMNTAIGIILITMVFSFWISRFVYLKRPKAK